ncbi:MAG: hypothetical protein V1859_06770 [archaeon]
MLYTEKLMYVDNDGKVFSELEISSLSILEIERRGIHISEEHNERLPYEITKEKALFNQLDEMIE